MTALQKMRSFNGEGLDLVIRWNRNWAEFVVRGRIVRVGSKVALPLYLTDDIDDAIETARAMSDRLKGVVK